MPCTDASVGSGGTNAGSVRQCRIHIHLNLSESSQSQQNKTVHDRTVCIRFLGALKNGKGTELECVMNPAVMMILIFVIKALEPPLTCEALDSLALG